MFNAYLLVHQFADHCFEASLNTQLLFLLLLSILAVLLHGEFPTAVFLELTIEKGIKAVCIVFRLFQGAHDH